MYKSINDTVLEDLGNGVKRRVLVHGGKMMGVVVEFEEGSIGAMHHHPHEQLTYILEGEFDFTIGSERHLCKAGDTLYKEPNVEHGCICLKKGKLLDTFTPQRDDFLKN